MSSTAGQSIEPLRGDAEHGPLPGVLLVLTTVTGLVDAVSYLKLGHVFVANITGNIAFLGFALADVKEFSVEASLIATGAFLVGALGGGRLGFRAGRHRARLLAIGIVVEVVIVGLAFVASFATMGLPGELYRYALVVLLGLAMGLQSAVSRRLGVPDLPTTVLTLTLAGLAADSRLAGGNNLRAGRRLLATGAVLLGAAAGAWLIFNVGVGAVLAFALVLLGLSGMLAFRNFNSAEKWTVGA